MQKVAWLGWCSKLQLEAPREELLGLFGCGLKMLVSEELWAEYEPDVCARKLIDMVLTDEEEFSPRVLDAFLPGAEVEIELLFGKAPERKRSRVKLKFSQRGEQPYSVTLVVVDDRVQLLLGTRGDDERRQRMYDALTKLSGELNE